jgi:hypothetical protein
MRPYRELKKQNSPKVNDLMKKWGNELNRTFSKEKVQMDKKNRKEMVTIPGHKGNANQNHIKILPYSCYHSQPSRIPLPTNIGEDARKETLTLCWRECKLLKPLWKTLWRLF